MDGWPDVECTPKKVSEHWAPKIHSQIMVWILKHFCAQSRLNSGMKKSTYLRFWCIRMSWRVHSCQNKFSGVNPFTPFLPPVCCCHHLCYFLCFIQFISSTDDVIYASTVGTCEWVYAKFQKSDSLVKWDCQCFHNISLLLNFLFKILSVIFLCNNKIKKVDR